MLDALCKYSLGRFLGCACLSVGGKALCFYLFYARWVWENKRVKTMCLTRGKQGLSVGWKTPLQGKLGLGGRKELSGAFLFWDSAWTSLSNYVLPRFVLRTFFWFNVLVFKSLVVFGV
ncbi:hypothetical protein DI487_10240 [Flavobacterium sediminis]|uniref:Uncharacterized protein n=1 Tax=Flavobacterium sediminis TaxID=2201181 RepID=A0A2U8QVX9_9FLAO|nr:hypothetical protein DI487_10240 [Flavobacterium sediminis]